MMTARRSRGATQGTPGDYEVGYRRPPREHRFKKGEPSRNTKGRPRGQNRPAPDFVAALLQPVTIRMQGKERKVSFPEAMIQVAKDKALRGVNGGDKLCQIAARKCTDLVKRKGAMKPRLISCFHADSCFGGEVSFVLCFGVLALPLGRSPLRLLAGGEAVAFAIHLQDMDMMSEPVE
jgi:hypothetical protein